MQVEQLLETSLFLKYWNILLTIAFIFILSKWMWNKKIFFRKSTYEDSTEEIHGGYLYEIYNKIHTL